MPRRQSTPLGLLFVILLPFIIAGVFKNKNTHSHSKKKAETVKVDIPVPVKKIHTKMSPEKEFLINDRWNINGNPEKDVKVKEFMLIP